MRRVSDQAHVYVYEIKSTPWEYQPENVVQGIINHSVPSSFQYVLTRYEKILAIKECSKICVFGER